MKKCAYLLMKLLQIRRQIVDALCIQELSDDVGWLQIADGSHILSHSSIVVMLTVQMVSVAALDLSTAARISL